MALRINKVPRAHVRALVQSLHLAGGRVSISLRYSKGMFWPKVTAIPLGPAESTILDKYLGHIWGVSNTAVVFRKNTLSAAALGELILTQYYIPCCHGDLFIHQEHSICSGRAGRICQGGGASSPGCLPTQSVLMKVCWIT